MQRIFKFCDIQNNNLTLDKELNILIYWTSSYVIIYISYTLLKWSVLVHPVSFTGLVQRIFNRDKIQDNNVTSDKVMNIFIYDLQIDLTSKIQFKSRYSKCQKVVTKCTILVSAI